MMSETIDTAALRERFYDIDTRAMHHDLRALCDEVDRLRDALREIRSWHGNSVDPSECMECDHDTTDRYPHGEKCRTVQVIDRVAAIDNPECPRAD